MQNECIEVGGADGVAVMERVGGPRCLEHKLVNQNRASRRLGKSGIPLKTRLASLYCSVGGSPQNASQSQEMAVFKVTTPLTLFVHI